MSTLKRIKYPKLLLLLFTFILAYFLLSWSDLESVRIFLSSTGYFGAFIAGLLFSYGFTTAPATATFLLLAKDGHPFITGFVGGLGALISDIILFKLIRYSMADEIKKLSKEKIIDGVNHSIPKRIKRYLIPAFAGIIIASPLPDEIGVALFSASTDISPRVFAIVSYMMNTAGILFIIYLGRIL